MKKTAAFVAAVLCFLQPSFVSVAQPVSRVAVIGWLAVSAGPDDPAVQALRVGLRDIGYVEGRDYRLEHRRADGHLERLPALAEELVKLHVDVILTAAPEATRAALQATRAIPIVMVEHNHDPVALGFIQSFSHPGGNVTGLTIRNTQLAGKRLELLKEAMPSLTRVAVFWDAFGKAELESLKPAAAALGIHLQLIDLSPGYDLTRAFRDARLLKAEAITVLGSAPLYIRSAQLGAMALESRIPLIGAYRDLQRSGSKSRNPSCCVRTKC